MWSFFVLQSYSMWIIVVHVMGIDGRKISENICLGVKQQPSLYYIELISSGVHQ